MHGITKAAEARDRWSSPPRVRTSERFEDWGEVRRQFQLSPDLVHMSGFYLGSHPAPVRRAIERHRARLDADPFTVQHDHGMAHELRVLDAAGRYLGVDPADIALTDSTTMGLGLVYAALRLGPGDEILTTSLEHYSARFALELRAVRTGAVVRRVRLPESHARVTGAGLVADIVGAITPATRVLALTWVYSQTGLKLPIRTVAGAMARINRNRAPEDRILLVVDGVHGLGIENVSLPDLGCDVFIAGTHKWLFGPRGTGLVWARPEAQDRIPPLIPPFPPVWFGGLDEEEIERRTTWGMRVTPGGFHSFEHRWALAEAFEFHQAIGKARVEGRVHELNRQLREGLAAMPHVTLHTPSSDELTAGIVCFEVRGTPAAGVVRHFARRRIIASVTPFDVAYARLAPGLLNTLEEIERCLSVVAELRSPAPASRRFKGARP
jgi:isopenicillin-N epimerase